MGNSAVDVASSSTSGKARGRRLGATAGHVSTMASAVSRTAAVDGDDEPPAAATTHHQRQCSVRRAGLLTMAGGGGYVRGRTG